MIPYEPMLATALDYEHDENLRPLFTEQQFQWTAEDKKDGIRSLLYLEPNCSNTRVLTRVKGKHTGEYADKYHHIPWLHIDLLVDKPMVLDGEFTWGKNSRETMSILGCKASEAWKRQFDTRMVEFTAYDVLYADGDDWRYRTYERRSEAVKTFLEKINPRINSNWQLMFPVRSGHPKILWNLNAEGIMLKAPGHFYQAGRRSEDWLKVKRFKKYIVVVTGHNWGKEGKTGQMVGKVGSLMVSMLDHRGILMQVGNAGTGLDMAERNILQWPVRTVIEVASSDVTEDGKLWHPRFLRPRPDLKIEDASLTQLLSQLEV